MSDLREAQLPETAPYPVGLDFAVAAHGNDCKITYNGQPVAHFTSFDIHCRYGEPTRVELEGFLADGGPVTFSGRLLPDAD